VKSTIFVAAMLCGASVIAQAQEADPVSVLTTELRAHVPPKWDVRVRWRDQHLLATITPLPYQEAFELWYDQSRLAETLSGFCPKAGDEVWRLIKDEQDIVLEPTVGGKTGVEARLSCRALNKQLHG
jgi:hypothetical protein